MHAVDGSVSGQSISIGNVSAGFGMAEADFDSKAVRCKDFGGLPSDMKMVRRVLTIDDVLAEIQHRTLKTVVTHFEQLTAIRTRAGPMFTSPTGTIHYTTRAQK